MRFILILILIFGLISILEAKGNGESNEELRVYFLYVGNGDGIYIDLFGKKNILIDTGPPSMRWSFWRERKGGLRYFLNQRKIKKIDQCIISHADMDHIGQLRMLLKKIKIEEIIDPGYGFISDYYRSCLKMIEEKKIEYRIGRRGMEYEILGVNFLVLSPGRIMRGVGKSDANTNSLVLKMRYKEVSFLFTGDISKETEESFEELDKRTRALMRAKILKVPHHGSEDSSSRGFIELVSPEVGVISCGRGNSFGHPSEEVLERYESMGVKIYRTDLEGDIEVITDGKEYEFLVRGEGVIGER